MDANASATIVKNLGPIGPVRALYAASRVTYASVGRNWHRMGYSVVSTQPFSLILNIRNNFGSQSVKLIMTKGLPSSGKSTWAKEQLKKGGYKRINKDDLRRMLDNSKHSGKNEDFVLRMRNLITINAIENGYNVIIDDTNLHPKHETFLRSLCKTSFSVPVEFEIKDFTDVPIETCIKRDLMRLESVGESVIRKMYNDFLAPKPETPVWDDKLPNAIICDMDGTLALFPGKSPYNRDFENDIVNEPVRSTVNFASSLYRVVILSGREDQFQAVTEKWLNDNEIHYDEIHMRKSEDVRNDSIVKEEMYREYIEGQKNVFFVLDDRNRVVDLWRRLGLTCFQVAPGDF